MARTLLQSYALPALLGLGVVVGVVALPQRPPPRGAASGPWLSPGSRIDPGRTRTDRIVVRFAEGQDESNEDFRQVLAKYPGTSAAPHFAQSPQAITAARWAGEERLGAPLPDLNRYRHVTLPPAMDPSQAGALLRELSVLPCVAAAFAEPIAEPAALEPGDDGGSPGAGRTRATTPDFTPLQLYLGNPPIGLGMTSISSQAGARGRGVRLIDIEAGWNWSHEDLPDPFYRFGPAIEGWEDHGTAVLGELVGKANGRGIEGIVPELEVGTISFSEIGVAAAIDLASSVLDVGDIILIELHAPGPNAPHGGGQFGFVPMEYWQDVFDAIQIATANGRIVVEAAGNGEQNLDDPIYGGLFDRNVRDSGAVLVAAGTPLDLKAEWFTNYGSRVDLHGWGTSITTAGYGTLHDAGRNALYTTGFGGTSGASPMVCGAIASLQGMCRATYGVSLDRELAVEILTGTGSRAQGAEPIGPRPDLTRARQRLMQGVGRIRGDARESTGRPLAGVRIVLDGSRAIRTDARGRFAASVLPGSHSLVADGFWHQELRRDFEIESHETAYQNLRLEPRPLGTLIANVTRRSEPAMDAPVQLLQTPVSGRTDSGGELDVTAPHGSYVVSAGPLPGTGVAWQNVTVADGPQQIELTLPEAETFEETSGGLSSESGWELGTPASFPTPTSGRRLWATNLEGEYGDHAHAVLTSAPLPVAGASSIQLSFSHWYRIESAWDGGQVQVWDGTQWRVAIPIGGYPMDGLSALDWGPGYSGASSGWEAALFDLSSLANDELRIRFVFASDESVTEAGWFLDDVAISIDAHGPTTVPPTDPSGIPLSVRLEPASPNPFSGSTRLRYAIATAGRVDLTVHDVSGRLVRRLVEGDREPGVHELLWDGADDAGAPLPAGMYFLRLRAGPASRAGSILRVR